MTGFTKKLLLLSLPVFMLAAPARATPATEDDIVLGEMSLLRRLVPAEELEAMAAEQYAALKQGARQHGVLASVDDPRLLRLQRIAQRIKPHVIRWNERAAVWQWEITLIDTPDVNAFCMPGGKIAFFAGLIDQLRLTDDEIAIVMGHEIAHALREHGRERVARSGLMNLGAFLASWVFDMGDMGQALLGQGAQLTLLKFSRDDEIEADSTGLDIVARAGFDPRAGVVLWQKMAKLERRAPPQWLSTHPAGSNRITEIKKTCRKYCPCTREAGG